jgi:hypothetical protein
MELSQIIEITGKNAVEILPNLSTLYTPLEALH